MDSENKMVILIVEDDLADQKLVKHALRYKNSSAINSLFINKLIFGS